MSKFKLGYLKPDKTVWQTLEGVHVPPSNPKPVRLELKSSGRINAEYTESVLKLNREREKDGVLDTVNGLEASDAKQLRLFSRHVVVGWDEVRNADDSPMPFSARDVEDLLVAISIENKRPDLIGPAMYRAADQSNFDTDPIGSAETLGKP
jgi:hypothetical protein